MKLCIPKVDRMSCRQSSLAHHLLTLSGLVIAALVLPGASFADDLFVGNFFGPGHENLLEYNATTGAFIGTFGPPVSFPLGAAFGPDGSISLGLVALAA